MFISKNLVKVNANSGIRRSEYKTKMFAPANEIRLGIITIIINLFLICSGFFGLKGTKINVFTNKVSNT